MKLHATFIITTLLLFALVGCRGDKPKRMPDTLPDVRGSISKIEKMTGKSDQTEALIMVRSIEGIDAKYPEANIRIDKNTLIESSDGELLKVDQLREGNEVEAWFEGDVMESVPVQGYVKAVRVRTAKR